MIFYFDYPEKEILFIPNLWKRYSLSEISKKDVFYPKYLKADGFYPRSPKKRCWSRIIKVLQWLFIPNYPKKEKFIPIIQKRELCPNYRNGSSMVFYRKEDGFYPKFLNKVLYQLSGRCFLSRLSERGIFIRNIWKECFLCQISDKRNAFYPNIQKMLFI